jgi:hypothetical protein
MAWTMMKHGEDHAEADEDYSEQRDLRNTEHRICHHQRFIPE